MNREKEIENLKKNSYDVLIIGGGITGVGIALDAQLRGLKTALVESQDFASGTSSRSTKLIHGGLRYLKQFDFGLVMEVGRERAILHKLATHLVHPDKMLLPLIKDGNYGKILTNVGLMVYDWLANVEDSDQRIMLDKYEAHQKEPLIREDILEGAGFYAEYRTDDSRLVMAVAKTAHKNGVNLANYLKSDSFIYKEEKVIGVEVEDQLTKEKFPIYAKNVVNATGPWVDKLRKKDKSLTKKKLHLTKGVHIVVPYEKLKLAQTIYFDNQDGRMLFAIPRNQILYLGTTDTDYNGDISNPRVLIEDVDYILSAINNMFPSANLTINDVQSSWAGLRPLIHEEGKKASELSRKDEIFHSPSGLLSIAGGKLTGYRKMAERIVDILIEKTDKKTTSCITDSVNLDGNNFEKYEEVLKFIEKIKKNNPKLSQKEAKYLVNTYGINSNSILELYNSNDFSLIEAELIYCLKHEMVQNSLDFFERRTGRLNFDIKSVSSNSKLVINNIANYMTWNVDRIKKETIILQKSIESKSNFI